MALADVMDFPSSITLKVIGEANDSFVQVVTEVVRAHSIDDRLDVEQRPSTKGRFVSLNVTFTASSENQLEQIHQALTATGKVKLIL